MQRKMMISMRTLTNFFFKKFITTLVCVSIVSLNWNWGYAQYSKGDCIFRLTDEDGNLERNVPPDGWTPGHVGIWSGSGNGIWEAAKTHCYTKSEGWVTVDRVLLTNYSHYAWQEWEITRSNSILENSEAFMDSHFDYREEVRNAIVAYAAAQDGEPYNPPLGWYCTKLVHYAYRDAVTDFPAEHEPDYVGRPEKVTNLQSTSHSTSTWSNDNTVDFSWTTAYDFGSVKDELSSLPYATPITVEPLFNYNPPVSEKGIDGYSIVWDHNPETMPDVDLLDPYDTDDGSATSTTCSCPTDANDYYFHIRSLDVTGNYSNEAAHLGPFYIDTTDPIIDSHSVTHGGPTRTASCSAHDVMSDLADTPYRFTMPGVGSSGWISSGSYPFNVPDPDGVYTVTVEVRDKAGNTVSTEDTSLQVELSSFTALSTDGKITLYWRTETEVGNVGFRVYRSTQPDGPFTKRGFIAGAGNSAMPSDYQWTDTRVQAGQNYYYYIEDIDVAGVKKKSDIISIVVPPAKTALPIPSKFELLQNYPNPFNPETWLPYELAKDATVTIRIHNVNGQLVRQFSLGNQTAGSYLDKGKAAYWDGKNQTGEAVSSGIYFYTLKGGDFHATRRMVVVK